MRRPRNPFTPEEQERNDAEHRAALLSYAESVAVSEANQGIETRTIRFQDAEAQRIYEQTRARLAHGATA